MGCSIHCLLFCRSKYFATLTRSATEIDSHNREVLSVLLSVPLLPLTSIGMNFSWYHLLSANSKTRGWICWTQLIFGGFVQILHLLIVPESRATILLDREAKRRREAGEHNIYGPNEVKTFKERFSLHEMVKTSCRPFVMFATEPIVLCLSLLSGFSDALIFTFMEAFTPVYGECFIEKKSGFPPRKS